LEALKDGVELPWLHGIPISVKDQYEVKGTLVTIGCGYLSE
jgi:Asp-tRNA(Asn)/Glu-tRNA(Gln) amidotransferase A subunit family amidase